jgi:hypothetical protein
MIFTTSGKYLHAINSCSMQSLHFWDLIVFVPTMQERCLQLVVINASFSSYCKCTTQRAIWVADCCVLMLWTQVFWPSNGFVHLWLW